MISEILVEDMTEDDMVEQIIRLNHYKAMQYNKILDAMENGEPEEDYKETHS